jgi:23S rRNA G2069 N7-methylase RlmK/C1962 C5-methylase RlmI
VLKTRERQKGKNQYQKLSEKGEFFEGRRVLLNHHPVGVAIDRHVILRQIGVIQAVAVNITGQSPGAENPRTAEGQKPVPEAEREGRIL